MCGSMVSSAAEIRRGKKKERNHGAKIYWPALLHRAAIKVQFWGLIVARIGVKFGMEEGAYGVLLHAKFHPHRCTVSPLRAKNL